MKKFISLGLSLCLCSSLLIGTSLANDSTPSNQANIIANPQIIVNYNGSQDNPIKTMVHTLTRDLISDNAIDLNRDEIETLRTLDELFITNEITFVMGGENIIPAEGEDSIYMQLNYLLLESSESNFQTIIDMLSEFEHLDTLEYDTNTTIYSPYNREDFAFTYHNGSLFITSSTHELETILDLLQNGAADLSEENTHIQSNSFFSTIISEELTNSELSPLFLHSDKFITSVSQPEEDTFKIVSYTKGNEAEYTSHEFSYDLFNFSPELYKEIPAENISLYLEMNKVSTLIEKFLDLGNIEESLSTYETDDLNSFRESPFYELLDGNVALAVEFNEGILPNITFISDINNQDVAEEANEVINELILDAFKYSEAYPIDYNLSAEEQAEALSTALNLNRNSSSAVFSTDLTAELPSNEQALFPELADFELSYGLFNDFYLISNYPNIGNQLGETPTISDDNQFTELLAPALDSDMVLAYTYFNPTTLADYLEYVNNKMIEVYSSETETTETVYEETEDPCAGESDNCISASEEASLIAQDTPEEAPENEFLNTTIEILRDSNPWYSYTLASNTEAKETSVISLPVQRFAEFLSATIQEHNLPDRSSYYRYDFTDVDFENDWYADALLQAASEGVVDGGDDFMFHAEDAATRGMFVEMIIHHYNLENIEAPLASSIFDDVEEGSEYDVYLGIAYQEGIIQGDGNSNTMRPNDTLTRAEAVQMLRNYSSVLYGVDPAENPFTDVNAEDWFADAVGAAVAREITTGTTPTTFDPHATLNRAEAIVFINRISNREFSLF